MKKQFLSILCICFTSILFAQIHEVGVFVGGSNYVGDIGKTNYINPNKFAGGLVYKYNFNPRMAFRGTYTYLPIAGDDANASNPLRQQKGRNFTNNIHEVAVGMEYNFFEYDLSVHGKTFTPYILVELAAFNYKSPEAISSDNTISLKDQISYAIPFGLGIKGKLTETLAYAVEARARYTFVDDLDYSTSRYPDNPVLNYGGTGNDWYMFTGVSIVYTFGRPACYTDAR